MNDIRDGEHPSKDRFLAVPKGGGDHTWEELVLEAQSEIAWIPTVKEKTLESFLHL